MLLDVNEMLITLITKVIKTERIIDYPPISLCNVVYKIMVKMLANRFMGVLGEFISEM